MAQHSFFTIITILLMVAMFIAIPFPDQIVSAGTVWHEGPLEFFSGTVSNLKIGIGISLDILDNTTLNNWTNMNPPTAPASGYRQAMVYDKEYGVCVLFGGEDSDSYFRDTWTYDISTNNWINKNPSNPPSAGSSAAMAYDESHKEVVMFGGITGSGYLGRTLIYNLSSNIWRDMNPSNPPSARGLAMMVYDCIHCESILFGGQIDGHNLNDTWTYNLTTNNWTNKKPSSTPPIIPGAALAFDRLNGEAILFGSQDSNSYSIGETWTYNLSKNTWTNMTPIISPPARKGHVLTYDNRLNKIILFGGMNGSTVSDTLNDTWKYDLLLNVWMKIDTYRAPWKRYFAAQAYDDMHDSLVLLGGYGKAGLFTGFFNDTWVYDYKTFYKEGNYTSSPQNAGGTAFFGSIIWDADAPSNTTLSFQFRSAESKENLTKHAFTGKDGTINSYYEIYDKSINTLNNGTHWFQYRVYFGTKDITLTPFLRSVTINYNLLHNLKILSPSGCENWTDIHTISWSATDPDNNTLFFDLFLIYSTGSVSPLVNNLMDRSWLWNTSNISNGPYKIQIIARDNDPSIPLIIESTTNMFMINHPITNHFPKFTSTPSTTAWVGQEYTYNLTSIDEDSDIPTYSLVSALTNMVLDPFIGKLRWTPTISDIGNHTVTVQVADGRGSFDNQTFTITVKEVPSSLGVTPKCVITYPVNGTIVKGTIQIKGTASNGSLPLKVIKNRIDNGNWSIAIGLENWTFVLDTAKLAKGSHLVEAKAFAANLSSKTATAVFTVNNPKPQVSTGGIPWCLTAAVIAIVASLSVMLMLRKKKGKSR